jgi:hypothetical protein
VLGGAICAPLRPWFSLPVGLVIGKKTFHDRRTTLAQRAVL